MATTIISIKYSASSKSCHHLLTHRVSETAVLIRNVPPWCNEEHLKSVLVEGCGGVKLVQFLSKAELEAWRSPTPPPIPVETKAGASSYFKETARVCFHDALVVFGSPVGVEKLVESKTEESLVLRSGERQPLVGLRRWISDYSSRIITDWDDFQREIDDYMIEYDEKKEAESARLKEMSEVADDDGWVTVTSKSKKGARKPNDKRAKVKAKAIGKKKELLNFYKFQKKEKKEDLIQSLREKFEEDKKRVASMRTERKFKPY